MTAENDNKKWDVLVGQLVALTREKKLPWSIVRPAGQVEAPDGDVKGMVFEGIHLGRTLYVYEYEYQHYLDEDRTITETDVAIELLAKNTATTWRLPETGRRFTLIDEIRKLTVEADDFAEAVLGHMYLGQTTPPESKPPKKA